MGLDYEAVMQMKKACLLPVSIAGGLMPAALALVLHLFGETPNRATGTVALLFSYCIAELISFCEYRR